MKKVLALLFCCIIFTPSLISQNRGYMGKRFMINAEAVVSPSWRNPNFWGGKEYYAFNYMFSPNIEIIAWNKGTVGLVGHYFNSQYSSDKLSYSSNKPSDYITDDYNFKFSTFGYGIFYKQYFASAKAPFGSYFKAEFDLFHYQNLESPQPKYDITMGAKLEFGKDYLFYDRLHLSLGFSMGLTFKHLMPLFGLSEDFSHSEVAAARVCGIYWLGFKLGIGFLAF